MYVCMYVCMYVYIYIYIYVHTLEGWTPKGRSPPTCWGERRGKSLRRYSLRTDKQNT